jgi:hypothetical protein
VYHSGPYTYYGLQYAHDGPELLLEVHVMIVV